MTRSVATRVVIMVVVVVILAVWLDLWWLAVLYAAFWALMLTIGWRRGRTS